MQKNLMKLLAITLLSLAVIPIHASTLYLSLTNSLGEPDTNVIKVVQSDTNTPSMVNGQPRTIGLPVRVYPDTNGQAIIFRTTGNYTIYGPTLGDGIIYRFPDDTTNQTAYALSGFNTFVTVLVNTNITASGSATNVNYTAGGVLSGQTTNATFSASGSNVISDLAIQISSTNSTTGNAATASAAQVGSKLDFLVRPNETQILFDRAYFTNLSDFNVTGTSPTTNSGGLLFPSVTANFDQSRLEFKNLIENAEAWDFSVEMRWTNSTYGFFLGRLSKNSNYGKSLAVQFGINTTNNAIYFAVWNQASGAPAASAAAYFYTQTIFTNGDDVIYTLSQRGRQFRATAFDVTLGKTVNYDFSSRLDGTTAVAQENLGSFVFGCLNQGPLIKRVTVANRLAFNPDYLIVGDSKTIGIGSSSDKSRWEDVLENYGTYDVFAGNGDMVTGATNELSIMTNLQPKNVILFIGRNDYAFGISSNSWMTAYSNTVSTFKSAGANVVHFLPLPEPDIDQSSLSNFIASSFASDLQFYPAGFDTNTMLYSDKIHPNDFGNRFVGQSLLDFLKANEIISTNRVFNSDHLPLYPIVQNLRPVNAGDGAGWTNLNGANIQAGTVTTNAIDSTFRSLLLAGGGGGSNSIAVTPNLLAGDNAGDAIDSGIAGTNVALLNADNTFGGSNTFSGTAWFNAIASPNFTVDNLYVPFASAIPYANGTSNLQALTVSSPLSYSSGTLGMIANAYDAYGAATAATNGTTIARLDKSQTWSGTPTFTNVNVNGQIQGPGVIWDIDYNGSGNFQSIANPNHSWQVATTGQGTFWWLSQSNSMWDFDNNGNITWKGTASGNGGSVTNLNGAKIQSGTIAETALDSTTQGKIDGAQTATGFQSFTNGLTIGAFTNAATSTAGTTNLIAGWMLIYTNPATSAQRWVPYITNHP